MSKTLKSPFTNKKSHDELESVLEEAIVLYEENKLQRKIIQSNNAKLAALRQQLVEAQAKEKAAIKLYEDLKAQMKAAEAEEDSDEEDEDDDD